jgi:hypothetical protein
VIGQEVVLGDAAQGLNGIANCERGWLGNESGREERSLRPATLSTQVFPKLAAGFGSKNLLDKGS